MDFAAKEVLVTQAVILLTSLAGIGVQLYREHRERKWRRENEEDSSAHWHRLEEQYRYAKPAILIRESDMEEIVKKRQGESGTVEVIKTSNMENHAHSDDKRTE